MSKTKGGGSTRNRRDSNAQHLGVKPMMELWFHWFDSGATAWNKFHPGNNVGRGR